MISDEKFFAWLDGELEPGETGRIGALVAADPELQRCAEAHRALQSRLGAAFDPIVDAPVPDRLLDAVRRPSAEVVDLTARRAQARPISRPMQWVAMAASLALGLAAGILVTQGQSSPVEFEGGRLVAADELEAALYTRLASAPNAEGVRIGLTFRDAAGDLCRSFADEGRSGVACHQGGDWRIRGLFQAEAGQQTEFRMAAGPDPRLAELVDSTIAGEPLDAAAESEALRSLR